METTFVINEEGITIVMIPSTIVEETLLAEMGESSVKVVSGSDNKLKDFISTNKIFLVIKSKEKEEVEKKKENFFGKLLKSILNIKFV